MQQHKENAPRTRGDISEQSDYTSETKPCEFCGSSFEIQNDWDHTPELLSFELATRAGAPELAAEFYRGSFGLNRVSGPPFCNGNQDRLGPDIRLRLLGPDSPALVFVLRKWGGVPVGVAMLKLWDSDLRAASERLRLVKGQPGAICLNNAPWRNYDSKLESIIDCCCPLEAIAQRLFGEDASVFCSQLDPYFSPKVQPASITVIGDGLFQLTRRDVWLSGGQRSGVLRAYLQSAKARRFVANMLRRPATMWDGYQWI